MSEHIGKHIRAVLFDYDDTMVATIGPKWAHHKYVAATYFGIELTDEQLRAHWGKPLKVFMRVIYGEGRVDQAYEYARACQGDFPKIPFADAAPTLGRIKTSGRLTGIVTSTDRDSLEHNLHLHGMPSGLIDYSQTEEATDYHKPDGRVFEPTIGWLAARGVAASQTIYIGNALDDMQAAAGAGFHFIGVETGLVTAKEFRAAGAISIPSIGALTLAEIG